MISKMGRPIRELSLSLSLLYLLRHHLIITTTQQQPPAMKAMQLLSQPNRSQSSCERGVIRSPLLHSPQKREQLNSISIKLKSDRHLAFFYTENQSIIDISYLPPNHPCSKIEVRREKEGVSLHASHVL
jgi:hypothetical protein